MRITNSMIVNNFLTNMYGNLEKTDFFSTQLSTNKKITRISDDTIGLITGMNARIKINTYEQYEDNIATARSWTDQAETALMDINKNLQTIREKTVEASTGTLTDDDLQNFAVAIEGYTGGIVEALNTTNGFKYVFGGYNVNNQPFSNEGGNAIYNGIDISAASDLDANVIDELGQNFELEVGPGIRMDVTFTGLEVVGIGDDNMLDMLNNLVADLEAGASPETISGYLGDIDEVMTTIMDKLVACGANTDKIDMLEDRYSADLLTYEELKSEVENVDAAEAIMNFMTSEAVYRQTLSVGSRIIMPTLMDYIN